MNASDSTPVLAELVQCTEQLMDTVEAIDPSTVDAALISQMLNVRAELLSSLPLGSSLTADAKTSLTRLCELDKELHNALATALDAARGQLSQVRRRQSYQHSSPRLVLESA